MGALLAVLCFLAGFSLLTEADLAHRAAAAQRATQLGQLYGDARFFIGQEESLERKYRLEPSADVLARHSAAETNLAHDLTAVLRVDKSAATRRLVGELTREQRSYAQATQQLFNAVDARNTPLVVHYDTGVVDPIFGVIEATVFTRSALAAREELRQGSRLRSRAASARTAITFAFAIGLLMLGAFSAILVGLRRRVGTFHRAEIARLAGVALTDSLTGLRNHRAFHEDLAEAMRRHARAREPLALVMLDLDGLKLLNDAHGHQAGDERLQLLATTLNDAFHGADHAYRVGGDEFAVILPGIRAWDALEATQGLHPTLAAHGIDVTAGIADAQCAREADGFIRDADLALIAGKRHHQAVTIYSPELREPAIAVDGDRDAEHVSSLAAALALAVDAKDAYTRSHCQTVSQLCALIATELALGPQLIGQMRLAGLLHDVGKIGVPDAILNKPGGLTDAEFEQMKRHSVLGAEIAAAAGLTVEARWIRHHHERYDGTGYPAGLAGRSIPLQSRIILAADAFEAMTSNRPYRDAPGREFAIAELTRNAGTQFDAEIVTAFCRALDAKPGWATGAPEPPSAGGVTATGSAALSPS